LLVNHIDRLDQKLSIRRANGLGKIAHGLTIPSLLLAERGASFLLIAERAHL
jgi:hypothetical protein